MTTQEKQQRRSRYVRDRKDVPKLVIGPRDIEILTTVFEFRFLRTDQITRLIKGERTSVERRLAQLWRAYFLERTFLPIWPGRPMPSRRAIYTIDKRAIPILQEYVGIDPKLLRDRLKQTRVGERYLNHSLMISNFRTILTLAQREKPDLDLLFFKHDKSLEDRFAVENKKWAVIPDAFFGLEDKEGVFYFFLEADRSTMTTTRFLNKMKAYWYWFKEKGHEKKFDIPNFRVLTLTISKERAENLREITLQVKGDGTQEGSTMFWFGDENQIALENPQSVFDKIWSMALSKDNKLHSILD